MLRSNSRGRGQRCVHLVRARVECIFVRVWQAYE
jgi:hypothetical protein